VKSALALVPILLLVIGAWFILAPSGKDGDGWISVPRDTGTYDNLPGDEVVAKGYLEANPRIIWALPKVGEPRIISEETVDRIVHEGLKEDYILFRKILWTQRLQSEGIDQRPSFEKGGKRYYLILSTGTEAWNSSKVLSRYEGKYVEIRGKWDYYSDPDYPERGTVIQLWPRSIRIPPQ